MDGSTITSKIIKLKPLSIIYDCHVGFVDLGTITGGSFCRITYACLFISFLWGLPNSHFLMVHFICRWITVLTSVSSFSKAAGTK